MTQPLQAPVDARPARVYTEYWTATLVRGLLALLAATAILFLPQMAATILLRPFAIIISILCLAAYGTIDSAIVLVTGFMLHGQRAPSFALRIQGFLGIFLGILLFLVAYDHRSLQGFLYIAAAQAACVAVPSSP